MALEVQNNFEETINTAKKIPYQINPRLQDGINKFLSLVDENTLQDKVEFYLFLKQEIINNQKSLKKIK